MSIVLRGYDEGLVVTIGYGKKLIEGIVKTYLIYKSYYTILSVEDSITLKDDEGDIYVS